MPQSRADTNRSAYPGPTDKHLLKSLSVSELVLFVKNISVTLQASDIAPIASE
jgi:hypothetical protein